MGDRYSARCSYSYMGLDTSLVVGTPRRGLDTPLVVGTHRWG